MNNMPRPAPISAICFIWTLVTVFQLYQFSRITAELPAWSWFYVIGISAAMLTGIAGIWMMKKWGLMLFVGIVIVNQAVAVAQEQWHINSVLLPVLVVVVSVAYVKQFR